MASAGEANGEEFSVGDAVILGILTVIGVLGFYVTPIDVETVASFDAGAFIDLSMLFLVFLALPMAWVANMSFEGFRKESFTAFIVLPGVFQGGFFAAVCLALPIAVVFGSYKARSTYNGKNPFWVSFKVGASLVTVLALVTATLGAYSMVTDEAARDQVRSGLTDYISETTSEVVNESLDDGGSNPALEQQQEMIVTMMAEMAENVSASTLQTTNRSLQVTMDQVEGTPSAFSEPQRTLIVQTMTGLRQKVPGEVSSQVESRISAQIEERMDDLQPSQDDVEQQVQDRVDNALDVIFEDERRLAGMTFVLLLSTIFVLKIPFQLLGGLFGYLLYRLIA